MSMHRPVLLIALTACLVAVPGAQALDLVSDAQINQMGVEAFDKLKKEGKVSADAAKRKQVQCIVDAILPQLPEAQRKQAWEVQVFEDPEPNAFALPGGKVGVNTGMFGIARNQDEMAAVIGHEIAHVTAGHSRQRVNRQLKTQLGLQIFGAVAGSRTSEDRARLMTGVLGIGAQTGYLLPNSRKQESQADLLGQTYMARAGFDPAKAADLWKNMMAANKKGTPLRVLSTHPNPEERILRLTDNLPKARAEYDGARKQGRRPRCG